MNQNKKSNKKISKESSLQVQNQHILKFSLNKLIEKVRTSFFASFFMDAAMTVETALVLPFIIFLILGFYHFILIVNLQMEIQSVLDETARDIARYTYIYEEMINLSPKQGKELEGKIEPELKDLLMNGFSSVYALRKIKGELGEEWLDSSCIKGGSKGIRILKENLLEKDDMVDIVLQYFVDIPYLPGEIFSFSCLQRSRIRAWTGLRKEKEDEEEQEKIVFITETGTVFHRSKYCTYLNPAIKEIKKYSLETIRNNGGEIYYPCKRCLEGSEPIEEGLSLYITGNGDRYHVTLKCSSLKRTIIEVPLSEVEERRPCSKCGGGS